MRSAATARVGARSSTRALTVRVQAKVTKSPSDPRVVRGTCYVTRDVRVEQQQQQQQLSGVAPCLLGVHC